jgi:hypothetical protein
VRALFSPSVRGRAAEGGRGSLTHHLELGVGQHVASAVATFLRRYAAEERFTRLRRRSFLYDPNALGFWLRTWQFRNYVIDLLGKPRDIPFINFAANHRLAVQRSIDGKNAVQMVDLMLQ